MARILTISPTSGEDSQGLPVSSAPVESTIKQINRRVKGSEKFWLQGGAEAILQLRAAQLSEDTRWQTNWSRPRKHRRVVDGVLQLDQRLDLPDNSRVRVVVETLEEWRIRAQTGIAAWKQLRRTHPINSGGRHYARDQLHERR